MSAYQATILEIAPDLTPDQARRCENMMRLEYRTLGHLSRQQFRKEIRLFRAADQLQPGCFAA